MSNLEPAYLLLGPELGKKAEYIDTLKARTADISGTPLEEYRFYPFETQAADIISLIKNGSLFAGSKFVQILQTEALPAADRKIFADYMSRPSKDTVLVFSSEETNLGKSFASFERAFTKTGKTIFWELFENEKRGWLTKYFRDKGFSIEPDAVELILDMVENNTVEMRRECEKIILLIGDRKTIDTDDIEQFLFHSKEETVFSLFRKIAAGNFVSSLEALQKILDSGESSSVQLTGGLLWQFQKLLDVRLLIDHHYSFKDACDHANIRGKRNQAGYQEGLRNYTTGDLRRIITVIGDFDAAMRLVRSDMQRTILDMLLYACVQKKGRIERLYSEEGLISNFA